MSDAIPKPYEKLKTRRHYFETLAIDPNDGTQWHVYISEIMVARVGVSGKGKARELGLVVRPALLNPTKIFRGVRDLEREIDENNWLCYSCRPSKAYDYKTGEERAAWPGQVMLIYVTDERVLYNWHWVKADPDRPGLPVDFETRFRCEVL